MVPEIVSSWVGITVLSFNHYLSVPCGRLWSMSMDTMEFEKDYIVVYLLITFAVFPLKQWLSQHMNLWSSFFTSTNENHVFFFLIKSQREKQNVTLILGGTLLEGGYLPCHRNHWFFSTWFFFSIRHKSEVLTVLFDAKCYTLEHWKKFLSWCWLIS